MFLNINGIGRLTQTPELRYLPSGMALVKLNLATNKKNKDRDESCFIEAVAFGKTAETINSYCSQGSELHIVGELKQDKWTAQDGTNRSKHVVTIEKFGFVGSKKNDAQNQSMPPHQPQTVQQSSAGQYNNAGTNYTQPPMDGKIPEIDVDEDEIPF